MFLPLAAKSVRARLFLALAGVVLASVVVTVAAGALLVRRSVERDAIESLERQADVLAVRERVAPATPERLANLGVFLATQQQRVAILSRRQAALLLPGEGGAALRAGRPSHGSLTIRGRRFLYAAHPAGQRAVVLLRSASLQAADWHPFLLSLLVAGLAGAALAALAAVVLARALARPIRQIASATRTLAAGEQPGPIPVEGADEVASLAGAFNEMAEQLATAREAERSFLLSVSHELKTPLTAISAHAEALVDGVLEPGRVGEAIRSEASRLRRLVGDLLDLARLNQRTFAVGSQTIDLAEIAREAAARYAAQAAKPGISLVADGASGAFAQGDRDRVLQALSNLVENALRCTPSGGSVTVTAKAGTLIVEDTGPGLDAAELPRAFERFYLYNRRGNDRRVGTGLGLAIVKELTEAMGGTVAAESRPGRGTRFTITLPAAPAQVAFPQPVLLPARAGQGEASP